MSDHEELQNSVACWVLGAGEADEAEMLRAHLETCASCREMVKRLDRAVHALPLAVDEAAPSAGLRERILAAAAASPRLAVVPARPENEIRLPATYRRRFSPRIFERIPTYAAAAAVVVALALGAVAGDLAAQRNATPAPSQVARFTLTGHAALAGATASVINLKTDGVALVDFNGLPPPPAGKVYEVWLITSSSRADPAAVFVPDSNGAKVVVVNHSLAGYTVMAVTIEQGPDGSKVPSQQPEMSGTLA
jgi:anti-sigma-K factor RskA